MRLFTVGLLMVLSMVALVDADLDWIMTRVRPLADLMRQLAEIEAAAPIAEPAFRIPPPSSEAMIEHLKGLGVHQLTNTQGVQRCLKISGAR